MSIRPLRTNAAPTPRTKGERIRFARISKGVSQQQLADGIGRRIGARTSKSLVSQWERDAVQGLSNESLFAIESLTGFSARWIVTGKGQQHLSAHGAIEPDTQSDSAISILHRAAAGALQAQGGHPPGSNELQEAIDLIYQALEIRPELGTIEAYNRLVETAAMLRRKIDGGQAKLQAPVPIEDIRSTN